MHARTHARTLTHTPIQTHTHATQRCRRLAPPFRLRVDVRHKGHLSLPLTVRACLITQLEKDNMQSWLPEEPREWVSSGVSAGWGWREGGAV